MRRGPIAFAAVAFILVASSCSKTSDTGTETAAQSTAGTWTTFGLDESNSRYAAANRWTAADVARLGERWQLDLGTGVSSTPAVEDGTVYFGDWTGKAHAVAADSGKEIWSADVGSPIMSSPTLAGDVVLVATGAQVTSIDKASGDILWQSPVSDHPIAIAPGSPVVMGDLVVQGVASGELMVPVDDYSFRGALIAYELATGKEKWRLWLTPDDDSAGAGVGIWSTPAFDAERGLLYVGTGNTYEPPQAPLSDSIVAVEVESGKVKWSRQFTAPDVWSAGHREGADADVGAGPNLWTTADGRALVGAGDKQGTYYALDRDTGEIVWSTKLSPGSALGGVIGTAAVNDELVMVASNIGNGANGPTGNVKIAGLDREAGTVVWERQLAGSVFAPLTVTKTLLFVGTTAADYFALRTDNGETAWSAHVPDQVGSGPSLVDDTLYWGYGYALFGSGKTGGLFALGLDAEALPSASTTAAESVGAKIYRTSCASCHGLAGQGGAGPTLVGIAERLQLADHLDTVRKGRYAGMPPFGQTLTEDEIAAVVDYERNELHG